MGITDHFKDVLDEYPNAKPLKEGGQKAVFLISNSKFGKVVLKVGMFSNPQTLERIKREVKILQGIDSKYYPKIFDFIILDVNRFKIIEEYVDCTPLSGCLCSYKDPKNAMLLLQEIVIGLTIIWKKQIVHRDLKPDNILITSSGYPIIIDLGIARSLDEESITQTLAMMGPATPYYAAPEQLLNRKSSIDIRTDQFNLGIILMQLLLGGEHPFNPQISGGGISIVDNIINNRWCKTWLDTNNLPSIKPLVERLLGKEPFMRYRSPDTLLETINTIINGV